MSGGLDAPWVGRYDVERYVRDYDRAARATVEDLLAAPDADALLLDWTEDGCLRAEARAILTALVVAAATEGSPPLGAAVRLWRLFIDGLPDGLPDSSGHGTGERIPADQDPAGRVLAALLLKLLAAHRGMG